MAKRILLIAYPFAGTGANMLRYRSFANYLVKKGYHVDVIGFYDLKDELDESINYIQITKCYSLELFMWFIILFFRNLYLLNTISVARYINRVGLAAVTLVEANKLIKKQSYESCLVSIAPWAYYLIIKQLSKKVKVVLDICDPLYKNAITNKSSNLSNLYCEKIALENAEFVVTVNEPTIEIMTTEMNIPRGKIAFIAPAMSVDSYLYNKELTYELHKPLKLIYSGSLYKGYRDLTEIEAAVNGCDLDLALDVYTNNSSNYRDSQRVRYHDWISHQDLLYAYQNYDILLFIDNAYGYQVPSKIFEMLAQNKPILFLYDQRNLYFYNMLKEQKGIFFVENKRSTIDKKLKELYKKKSIDVCYTFDMTDYKEEEINKHLLSILVKK